MQRRMQNLSFFMIVSVLLSCAFFFSQQTNSRNRQPSVTVTLAINDESLAAVPDCEAAMPDDEKPQCFGDSEAISQRLVEAKVADILSQESDPERRNAFMETQFAWETSRDADCNYLKKVSINSDGRSIDNTACIHSQNLARLKALDDLYCDWYDPSGCSGGEIVDD